jgi:hypothetical protein
MPIHPRADEDRHVQAPIEPCELPDGIELVYADNRDRRYTIALEDAAPLDFGSAKPFRKLPAYRGRQLFARRCSTFFSLASASLRKLSGEKF